MAKMDVTGKRKRNDTNYKVLNDPIHGHIEINPLCMKIIDTQEFQRLGYIKQQGACYYVYPGASHNRFEHSIGVCHLAGEMVSRLKKQQPGLDITEDNVLCVKTADPCHDLGHGSFSHVFDGKLPLVVPGSGLKVMNDPIHGHIEIHPLCMKIVDTPEFQRLRYIKQLGAGYYVYPGASHNRFEHSIGVCHLAGEMVSRLKNQQPELDITDEEVLCVKIAGLCHDLGHGPFSHVFDGKFIPLVVPESGWNHEKASIQMFEHLIKKNNLDLKGLNIDFIKNLITGLSDKDEDKDDKDKDKKKYLYEIVANKRNSVDVDKFDYFARDSYMLGIKNNFDHHRFMGFCRVIEDENDDLRICIRDKEAENLYEMFHTRKTLHSRAYQHAVTQAVESMIVDALVIADQCESFTIFATNDKPLRLSECINDMVAYTKLDDTIFQRIMWSTEPELQGARVLIDRIQNRQLYKCIGLIRCPDGLDKEGEAKMLEEIAGDRLNSKFLRLSRVSYDYGMENKDPVSHARFYSKNEPNQCLELCPEQGPQMLPQHFQVDMIRIFCTERDEETMQVSKSAFEKWCSDKELKPENIRGGFRFQKVTKKKPRTQ